MNAVKRTLSLLLVLVLLVSVTLPARAMNDADHPETPALALERGANKKLIAITFDDGPGAYTNRLLDGLKAKGVKATFFMLGSCASNYPSVVARVYKEGHQVANHSWDHPELTSLSDYSISNQVQSTISVLNRNIGGAEGFFFRCPYGSYNSRVASCVGLPMIYWSVDTLDWKYRNAYTVRNNVVSNAYDGAIVLLHDIHSTSVDGILMAIDDLKASGYELVTVRELLRRRGITPQNGVTYFDAKPNGTADPGPITPPTVTTGVQDGKTLVTLTAQPGASIYYTYDGADPLQGKVLYTGPFTINGPRTVRAFACYHLNGARSEEISQKVGNVKAQTPVITASGGTLRITSPSAEAALFYTLDGSTATVESGTRYSGPVSIPTGTVISAVAGGEGFFPSDADRAYYAPLGTLMRDVFPSDWYADAMDKAAYYGTMKGEGGGYFHPKDNVTREMMITFLYRRSWEHASEEDLAAMDFEDVSPEDWSYEAIAWGQAAGIIQGYNGKFNPGDLVTRQEMAAMIVRYLNRLGQPMSPVDLGIFGDADAIADWAAEPVSKAVDLGLFAGDSQGNFRPAATATRAEAVTVLMRLREILQW